MLKLSILAFAAALAVTPAMAQDDTTTVIPQDGASQGPLPSAGAAGITKAPLISSSTALIIGGAAVVAAAVAIPLATSGHSSSTTTTTGHH